MGKRILLLLIGNVLLPALVWAQVPGRMVVTSPDGTREVEVSPGQAIYVTCPDGTCAGGGGVSAAVDLTKIGGVVLGGADVVDVPNTAFRVNCVVGCSSSSFTDNSAFTFGTTAINIAGYVFDDVAPNAATENRAAAPRMSGNRVPYSILRDAAGNERGANVTAANALKVDGSGVTQPISGSIGLINLTQTHNTIPNPTLSLQIGGANTDGGTHRHVGASNADPGVNDVGLFVRNISGMGTPGSAAPSIQYVIAGRDPVTNAVRQVDSLASAPTGTENGVIVRNIPSGTQNVSLAAETTKVIGTVNQGTSPWVVNLITGFALEATQLTGNGSLASIKTNTDPLVTAGAGGYVRQDSTATIAKESGGNLAASATSLASIDSKLTAPLSTVSKVALTANAPATASVGVASASALAANASRKGLVIVNVSNAKVCLGIGSAAVIDNGICLQPDASWSMNEYSFATGAINAIASAAASPISIQEFQ